MSLRTVVFWLHLLVGVVAAPLILFMSVTGVILAFEPQLTEWLERDRRIVTPPPDPRRLSADVILARAHEARPDVRPTALTMRSDPTASAVVSFGREGGALFVDPYRGVVLGGLSPVHDALHKVVEWHRWLGSREIGHPFTGAANLASSDSSCSASTSGGRAASPRRRSRRSPGSGPVSRDARATSTGTT